MDNSKLMRHQIGMITKNLHILHRGPKSNGDEFMSHEGFLYSLWLGFLFASSCEWSSEPLRSTSPFGKGSQCWVKLVMFGEHQEVWWECFSIWPIFFPVGVIWVNGTPLLRLSLIASLALLGLSTSNGSSNVAFNQSWSNQKGPDNNKMYLGWMFLKTFVANPRDSYRSPKSAS